MNIESAQYVKDDNDQNACIKCVIDGAIHAVPMDIENRHYAAILAWAEEDGNEIQAAE